MALHRGDGAIHVGHRLPLGHFPHQDFPGLGECHHRGGGALTFSVGDNSGLTPF